jgi:hypothetical protein
MKTINTAEQAREEISALDLLAEALEALRREAEVRYAHRISSNPTEHVEVLAVDGRAGVATNATAEWGEIETESGVEVVVLDQTRERWTLEGIRVYA